MDEKRYVDIDTLEDMMRTNSDFIDDMNKYIADSFKIAENPLKDRAFTYGQYNNWIKLNPGFTYRDYIRTFG